MPEGDALHRLQAIVKRLGGEYSSPVFVPHVTLIGGLREEGRVSSMASVLAASIQPLSIRLAGLSHTDEYYRCVFALVEENPGVRSAFRAAYDLMGGLMSSGPRKPMPHLSLLYGEFPEEKRKMIIKDLGSEHEVAFRADTLHMYSTGGPPPQWERLRSFYLGRPRA